MVVGNQALSQPHRSHLARYRPTAFSASSSTACQQIHRKKELIPDPSAAAPAILPFSVCGCTCPPTPSLLAIPKQQLGVCSGDTPAPAPGSPLTFLPETAPLGPSLISQRPKSLSVASGEVPCGHSKKIETVWLGLTLLFAIRSLSHMLMNSKADRADSRAKG